MVHQNVALAPHTTMRIGGPADFLAEVVSKEDLREAVKFAKEKSLPLFFLGGGSNVLFSDRGFRGLVLKMKNKRMAMRGADLFAESGVLISELVRFGKKNGKDLSGFLALPGTWGGAVAGNAGIPGWEAKDTLIEAELFDLERETFEVVPKEWFQYEYRNSRLHTIPHRNFLIWSATQTAPEGDPEEIERKCRAVLAMRKEKQPAGLSSGSFFKNLPETPDRKYPENTAGWLLDQAGVKGKRVSEAAVSEMHANFLQNTKNATQADMIALARECREAVETRFGVRLEPEVRIFDEFGKILAF